jgi:hypothetical protein
VRVTVVDDRRVGGMFGKRHRTFVILGLEPRIRARC